MWLITTTMAYAPLLWEDQFTTCYLQNGDTAMDMARAQGHTNTVDLLKLYSRTH